MEHVRRSKLSAPTRRVSFDPAALTFQPATSNPPEVELRREQTPASRFRDLARNPIWPLAMNQQHAYTRGLLEDGLWLCKRPLALPPTPARLA